MGICVSCRCHERKAPEKRSVQGAGGPAKGAAAELLPRRVDRLPVMANSMSNIKMTNPIKTIVSKRRRRYTKDGFNLDLAYITDRLIAMGFPAEKLEGVYRNHIDEVYRFLEKMHKDHYKIYNLCSERSYDSSKFHERVERYAFEDHTPPNIEMIQPFCEDVHSWLSSDSRNVAAVHCKAGKGRTGTMVCCYLLYSRQKTTADEALKFYGTKRTHDEKGVTIPSQRRYVEYYAWLLRSGLQYAPTKVHIRELVMYPPPFLHAGHAMPELHITQAHPFFKAPLGCSEVRRSEPALHVRLTHCTPLCGDVRVEVYNKHKMKRKEKLFHFWFNTFFLAAGAGAVAHPPLPDSPNLETFKLTLNKWQLDDAHKDKQHKNYSQDFKVELIVQKMPDSSTFSGHGTTSRAPSPPSSTASSCSEPDTEPDTHWDSGERHAIPYTRLTCDDNSLLEDAPTLNPIYTALSACGDNSSPGNACGDNAYALPDNAYVDNAYAFTINACDVNAFAGSACGDNAHAGNACDVNSYAPAGNGDATVDSNYANRNLRDNKPTVNPLYRSSDDATVNSTHYHNVSITRDCQSMTSDVNPATGSFDYSTEPMEYANDVFSSEPPSARESPVDECKGKRADDKSKPRLSLGDMRASWREFSGKFASDSRRRKDDS